MYGWSQRANEGKALLNFMQGCIGICSKGRNTVFGVPAFAAFCTPKKNGSSGFTQGCYLSLLPADFLFFLVENILLHSRKIGGDGTEIGTDHLVRHHRINLRGTDMLVTEYL